MKRLVVDPLGFPYSKLRNHTYQTSSGEEFQFRLHRLPSGGIRIFVVKQPSYGNRTADSHSTHRDCDDTGRYFIDIAPNRTPTKIPDAHAWAEFWADETVKYIRTGRPFS